MTQLINPSELEHLNEQQLRALYARILEDLIRSGLTVDESPLVALSLQNIRSAIQRRRARALRPH